MKFIATLFTVFALGAGAMAETTTTEAASAPTGAPPPAVPGTLTHCRTSGEATGSDLDNSEGICESAGGKYYVFSGCCVDAVVAPAFVQGCTDNGGFVYTFPTTTECDMA